MARKGQDGGARRPDWKLNPFEGKLWDAWQSAAPRIEGEATAESLLVAAPRERGPLARLGELCAFEEAARGGSVLWLCPDEALAEARARHVISAYGGALPWLQVRLSTREHRSDDAELLRTNQAGRLRHWVVATYEKALWLLARRGGAVGEFGVIIAEGLQRLPEPGYGEAMDLWLTRWKGMRPRRPPLVALASGLDDATAVARWLGVRALLWPRSGPEPPSGQVLSPLGQGPMLQIIAWLLQEGGPLRRRDAMLSLLGRTLGGGSQPGAALGKRLDLALAAGERDGLWRQEHRGERPTDRWQLSPAGEALALTGAESATLGRWRELLEDAEGPGELSLLLLIALAEEWEPASPPTVPPLERWDGVWTGPVLRRVRREGGDLGERLCALLEAAPAASPSVHRAARRALALEQLLNGRTPATVARQHRFAEEDVVVIARRAAWLAWAASEASVAAEADRSATERLLRLEHALARLAMAPRTVADDFSEPESAVEVEVEIGPAPVRVPRLRFPGENAGTIVFDGVRYQLTPQPYALLRLLATRPGQTCTYDQIHDALWPDAAVERQQIGWHRGEIARQTGCEALKNLIRTRPRWGLCLALSEEEIDLGPSQGMGEARGAG